MTAQKHQLKAETRTIVGRKVKRLRQSGQVPGNIFGKKVKSESVQFDLKQFSLVFSAAGESSLVYLQVKGENSDRPCFISHLSRNPVSGLIQHVAFHQVDLKEKVTAPVPVILVGDPVAEKEKIGIMVQLLDEVEIEALPTDMPENIRVDVSGLAEVGAGISVRDLRLDTSKLEIKTDPESLLVQIEALAKEEVAPVVAAPVVEGEAAPVAGETTPDETKPTVPLEAKAPVSK